MYDSAAKSHFFNAKVRDKERYYQNQPKRSLLILRLLVLIIILLNNFASAKRIYCLKTKSAILHYIHGMKTN